MPLIPYSKTNPRTYTSISTRGHRINEGPNVVDINSSSEFYYTDSFQGFYQPGWRGIIKNKGNATTPAQGTKQSFQDSYVSAECTIQSGSDSITRYFVGSASSAIGNELWLPLDGQTPTAEIDNKALIGFLKAAKAAQRKLMAGVVAGEMRQTINLIKNPAVGLRKLVTEYVGSCRGLRRGATPSSTLRHISNQWLEFSFGAKPLLADIYSSIDAVEKHWLDEGSVDVQYRARSTFSAHNDTIPGNLFSQFIPVTFARLSYRTYERRIRGGVRLMTTGYHGPRAETLGLTLPDFVPTVYELIPYSFLVDYFTNIGAVLDALSFSQADLNWVCSTSREQARRTVQIIPRRPGSLFGEPVTKYTVSPGLFTELFQSFIRNGGPLECPSFGLKIPDTWTKALNIGALASLRVLR